MGATSSQGWYLFLFIVGFTLGPAGLFALGWLIALAGFVLMGVAFVGFRSIKQPVMSDSATAERGPVSPQVGARAKTY